jgi:hypothetical protein
MTLSDNDLSDKRNDTPKFPLLKASAVTNNYAEWARKAETAFDDMGVLNVIKEPAPVQPKPIKDKEVDVVVDGQLKKGIIKGNQEAIDRWEEDNKEWLKKNKTALRWITNSVDGSVMSVIRSCNTAKEAWENLQAEFRPVNNVISSNLRKRILTYVCEPEMNVNEWILDMRRLYDRLVDVDPYAMSDEDFARTLLDLLPSTTTWRNFLSGRRDILSRKGTKSKLVIEAIRTEYFAIHKDDQEVLGEIYSARATASKRTAVNTTDNRSTKFQRINRREKVEARGERVTQFCSNCKRANHGIDNCYWPGGGKEGQFPWAPKPRPKVNNTEAKSLADRIGSPEISQAQADNNNNADGHMVNSALLKDHYVWLLNASDNHTDNQGGVDLDEPEYLEHPEEAAAVCKVPLLNMSILKSNHFFHDSGANRHIAHDRAIFDEYMPIKPISVAAFGDKLATHAIGIGSIKLVGKHEEKESFITLRNVLHIPAARSNLISQIQLDKVGINAKMGRGRIILEREGKPVVEGWVQSDMYRLNLKTADLNSQIENLTNSVANLKVTPGFCIA